MQISRIHIKRLFGVFDHEVNFPTPGDDESAPSVVILHGKNGVGKTTLLRMLDGLMRLDFTVFRNVPFDECALSFESGESLTVKSKVGKKLESLQVKFKEYNVELHPEHSGPLKEQDSPKIDAFRKTFFAATEDLSIEFVDIERMRQREVAEIDRAFSVTLQEFETLQRVRKRPPNPKARPVAESRSLAERIKLFIRDAQVNYRSFFSTTEPDLFPKIIQTITSTDANYYSPAELKKKLQSMRTRDKGHESLGLAVDRWDFKQLVTAIDKIAKKKTGTAKTHGLTILTAYVDLLESRSAERELVADRLRTFESILRDFLLEKHVKVSSKFGLQVFDSRENYISEESLSSGEYHLLFLMVVALTTKRRGTIVAIDEPEMSMHVEWQRQLAPALVRSASLANPLFIFATHSPDIAASFPDSLVRLE